MKLYLALWSDYLNYQTVFCFRHLLFTFYSISKRCIILTLVCLLKTYWTVFVPLIIVLLVLWGVWDAYQIIFWNLCLCGPFGLSTWSKRCLIVFYMGILNFYQLFLLFYLSLSYLTFPSFLDTEWLCYEISIICLMLFVINTPLGVVLSWLYFF